MPTSAGLADVVSHPTMTHRQPTGTAARWRGSAGLALAADHRKQRADRAAGEAALPDAEAVGGVVEQAGGDVANRVERRLPFCPVKDRGGEDQGRDGEPQVSDGE